MQAPISATQLFATVSSSVLQSLHLISVFQPKNAAILSTLFYRRRSIQSVGIRQCENQKGNWYVYKTLIGVVVISLLHRVQKKIQANGF